MSGDTELVGRLHAVLVEEIRARRPQYLEQPFTVAEIYQELVPYRSHRDRIGASMNGDYEHALLQLLSGQGGFAVLESEPARKRLVDELRSSNPNTGIFREYAALDVRLNPALIPHRPLPAPAAEVKPAAPPAPPPAAVGAPSLKPAGVHHPAAPAVPAAAPRGEPPPAPRPKTEPAPPRSAPSNCRWCRTELPRRASLRFCPFCGRDVKLVPCSACGEEIEPGWRFCAACGTQVKVEG
jgi:hypothetical protein